MSGSAWKTGAPVTRTQPIMPPTGSQLVRQLIALGLIGTVWLVGVVVVWGAVGTGADKVVIAEVDSQVTPVKRTAVPHTSTPTAVASPTSAPTTLAPTISAPTVSAPTVITAPTSTAAVATKAPTAAPSPTTAPTKSAPTIASPTKGAATAAPTAASVGSVSFSRNVLPIFDRICVKCHGGDETKEGLSLKSYADVMAGSNNGPVIVPGDVTNSFLIQQVVNGKMPKKGPRLLPAQIRTLSDWVAAGAPNN